MIVKKNKYWLEFESNKAISLTQESGKWVIFVRKAYNGFSEYDRKKIEEKVKKLCKLTKIGRIWISASYDLILVFTSAQKSDIWYSKKKAIEITGINEQDYIWKAHFETEEHWENKKGHLWLVSELEDQLSGVTKYMSQNRIAKANRIQKHQVPRLFSEIRRNLLEEKVMNRKSMVITPSFPVPSYDIDPAMLFIIMPFGEKWSDDVYYLIKDVASNNGMDVIRADEIFSPDIIINDIWSLINRAGLIIADITKHNANVFYELGIAHTLGKKVIMLRQDGGENAPFDISYWRHFNYELTPIKAEEFKQTLGKLFKAHLKEYE
jgi:hypothetical protein